MKDYILWLKSLVLSFCLFLSNDPFFFVFFFLLKGSLSRWWRRKRTAEPYNSWLVTTLSYEVITYLSLSEILIIDSRGKKIVDENKKLLSERCW